ncbi:Acetoin catabolism regulatory protein [compost metagenome]
MIEAPARQALLGFDWPGNVRQLRNVLRTLAALCEDGRIRVEDLPAIIRQVRPAVALVAEAPSEHPLDDAERLALLNALEQQRWHMTHTAEQLGVSRNTLYRKLRKHGIAR